VTISILELNFLIPVSSTNPTNDDGHRGPGGVSCSSVPRANLQFCLQILFANFFCKQACRFAYLRTNCLNGTLANISCLHWVPIFLQNCKKRNWTASFTCGQFCSFAGFCPKTICKTANLGIYKTAQKNWKQPNAKYAQTRRYTKA
jgi:hypothetical protein